MAALIGCTLLAACTSKDTATGASACGLADACGGDVVGTWKISTFCVSNAASPFGASCPSGTDDVSVSGDETFDVRADGTVSTTTNISVNSAIHVPTSCLGGIDCTALQSQLAAQGQGTVTCTASPTGCDCQQALPVAVTGSGTYTTSGSTFTVSTTGGSPQSYSYCVRGSTLQLYTAQSVLAMLMTGTKQ
jgi:hypothetical protein